MVNVLVFIWELSVSHPALGGFLTEFGVIPSHTIAVLTGHSYDSPVTAILPLFTSMFLHASFLHVGGNMLFLWIFGDNVEDYLGHFRYLLFYLVSGLAAAFTHILLNANSGAPIIGASGAIAGVMGALLRSLSAGTRATWFPPIFLFHVPAWLMLGYWFLVVSEWDGDLGFRDCASSGGIAFWAHVGGFVAGILMVKAFSERPYRYRYGTW